MKEIHIIQMMQYNTDIYNTDNTDNSENSMLSVTQIYPKYEDLWC